MSAKMCLLLIPLCLLLIPLLVGCGSPAPASYHIDKEGLHGDVGGGDGFTSTHWERYTDDRNGTTIVCFNPNNNGGGTSLNVACVTEARGDQ